MDLKELEASWAMLESDEGPTIVVSSFSDAVSTLQTSYASYDRDKLLQAMKVLSVHILHHPNYDPALFQETVLPILCNSSLYANVDLGILSLHLLSVISTRNRELIPQMVTTEFFEFCFHLLHHDNASVVHSAFICIHNLIHEGVEWRDLLLFHLPVDQLETEYISLDCDLDTRVIAMRVLCSCSFYPLDSASSRDILSVCANALSSSVEELYSPALWSIFFLADLSPGIAEHILEPPFPGLVETMTYVRDPETVIPALRISMIYQSAGFGISKGLCLNLISLFSHREAKVSKYAYECLKLVDPLDIERLSVDNFLETVAGVMDGTAFQAKQRVADLFCTILECSRSNIPERVVEEGMLRILLDLMDLGDDEVTARVIQILARFMQSFNWDNRVYYQLVDAGVVPIFEEIIGDQSEISELAENFATAFLQPVAEERQTEDIKSLEPREGPKRRFIARPESEEPIAPRPKLWIRSPVILDEEEDE
jgi:hypothetical protein